MKTKLTKKQAKIYEAILLSFPKTNKRTARLTAKEGGIKFDFKYK